MKKELMHNNNSMGIIGENTGHKNLKVGDVVFWESEYSKGANVVIKSDGHYALMGWAIRNLGEGYKILGKVVDSSKVTNEVLKAFNSGFSIRDYIQQPISFIEAVKAYAEGKTIRVEHHHGNREYKPQYAMVDNKNQAITREEILNGVWYIEESEE